MLDYQSPQTARLVAAEKHRRTWRLFAKWSLCAAVCLLVVVGGVFLVVVVMVRDGRSAREDRALAARWLEGDPAVKCQEFRCQPQSNSNKTCVNVGVAEFLRNQPDAPDRYLNVGPLTVCHIQICLCTEGTVRNIEMDMNVARGSRGGWHVMLALPDEDVGSHRRRVWVEPQLAPFEVAEFLSDLVPLTPATVPATRTSATRTTSSVRS